MPATVRAILVVLLALLSPVAAAQSVEITPAAAFLNEIQQAYDAGKAGNPAGLIGSGSWQHHTQFKVWQILEGATGRRTIDSMHRQYTIDPTQVAAAYSRHFHNLDPVMPIDDALSQELLATLTVIKAEADRARGYDRDYDNRTDADVIARVAQLANESVLQNEDNTGAPIPIETVKDMTDIVDRTAFLYAGAVSVANQNAGEPRGNFRVAVDRRFRAFERVNTQMRNIADPTSNRFSQTAVNQAMPTDKFTPDTAFLHVTARPDRDIEEGF